MSINDSAQVVGGPYPSINNLGQYVGGQPAGVLTANPTTTSVLVSGGTTTTLPALFVPYSINDSGQIAGLSIVNGGAGGDFHPGVYQNGRVSDLFPSLGNAAYYDSRAIAINRDGDVLLNAKAQGQKLQSYLYIRTTRALINLSALPGGAGMVAAALNNKGLAVGSGFLYSDGTVRALASLIPPASGWSSLVATSVNDAGQIVGQGLINGREQAFLMTPTAESVPEPGTAAVWALICGCATARLAARRIRRRR
jgi:hypothetical protein